MESSAQDIVDRFHTDGAVMLPNRFSQDWLDLVDEAIDRCHETPGPNYMAFTKQGSPGGFTTDMWRWFDVEPLARFALESPAAGLAARFLGTDQVVLVEDNWFEKLPGTRERTPWHQDLPYYDIDGAMVTVWVPLTPIGRDSAAQYVRGSHRWQRRFSPRNFAAGDTDTVYDAPGYEPMIDVDTEVPATDVLGWNFSTGDCVVFDGWTIHGSAGVAQLERRSRRIALRFAQPDAVYMPRGIALSGMIDDHGLTPGQRLADSVKFPTLNSSR